MYILIKSIFILFNSAFGRLSAQAALERAGWEQTWQHSSQTGEELRHCRFMIGYADVFTICLSDAFVQGESCAWCVPLSWSAAVRISRERSVVPMANEVTVTLSRYGTDTSPRVSFGLPYRAPAELTGEPFAPL